MTDLYTQTPSQIIMYGTSWCPDCHRARKVFSNMNVEYLDIDIEQDEKAALFVRQQNNGNQAVPTIIFPDGLSLTEPDRQTLTSKLEEYQKAA